MLTALKFPAVNPAELITRSGELLQKEQYEAAYPLLLQLLDIYPKDVAFLIQAGKCANAAGQPIEALEHLYDAYEIKPCMNTAQALAEFLYEHGHSSQALELCKEHKDGKNEPRQEAKLIQFNTEFKILYAECLLQEGFAKDANEVLNSCMYGHFGMVLNQEWQDRKNICHARALMNLDRPKEAQRFINLWKKSPNFDEALLLIGHEYEEQGNDHAARKAYADAFLFALKHPDPAKLSKIGKEMRDFIARQPDFQDSNLGHDIDACMDAVGSHDEIGMEVAVRKTRRDARDSGFGELAEACDQLVPSAG